MESSATIALMAALDLPQPADGADVPDWIHLSPVGRVETFDGRGPYQLDDPQAVIEASFAARGDIEIDVNHGSFKEGGDASARGWIEEMEVREDGIWGRVNWTEAGRQLVVDRSFRRISPVFGVAAKGSKRVVRILNASLVNRNNLRGLAALNHERETTMEEVLAKLKQMLGLAEDAEADEIWRSLAAVVDAAAAEKAKNASLAEAQSQMGEIAAALGCTEDAAPQAVIEAAKAAKAGGGEDGTVIAALQAEVTDLAGQLAEQLAASKREKAEAFVDTAISEGRPYIRSMRDSLISMHMEDPEKAETQIAGMAILPKGTVFTSPLPSTKDGKIALNSEQRNAAKMLGIPEDQYRKTLETERAQQETL